MEIKPRIIDIVSFNGEIELFKLRYEILKDIVDEFIIVQSPTTFSGNQRKMHYLEYPKVSNFIDNENYSDEEIEQSRKSIYTNGEERWMREWLQKESLKKALIAYDCDDEDIIYIGDVDEIWEHREPNGIEKLKLRVYTYYLNLESNEQFWGTIRCRYKDIKDKCLNDVRNDTSYRTQDYQGWHFTNMGGYEAVEQKIKDQYNEQFFNQTMIGTLLPQNFGIKDYIGRDFKLEINEEHWPHYLKEHKQEYINLCK